MINKKYLEEYQKNMKNYDFEIKKISKQIDFEYSHNTMDTVSGSINRIPYNKTAIKVEGINKKRINKLEKRKKIYNNRKNKIYKELKYKLDNLEDRLMADIIEKKYINKMSWNRIAIKIGYAGESSVRNYFNRYFDKK